MHTDAMVADCYSITAGKIVWSVECRRNLQDWEVQEFVDFLDCIYRAHPNPLINDALLWNMSKINRFLVQSFYLQLDQSSLPADHHCMQIWKLPTPPKFIAFGWVVILKRILTVDNLRKRGTCLVNICLCCMKAEKSVDHLLLHCPFISSIWADIRGCFGLSWCPP